MFTAAMFVFFWEILKCVQAYNNNISLWKPGPHGLAFYGSGLVCLPSWLGMVNVGWLCSMLSEFFLQIKFITFQGCPTKLPFYLGSLLHIISSLFSCFRSWDYPKHFGIYSQFDRKSEPGFSFCSICMFPELNRMKS